MPLIRLGILFFDYCKLEPNIACIIKEAGSSIENQLTIK